MDSAPPSYDASRGLPPNQNAPYPITNPYPPPPVGFQPLGSGAAGAPPMPMPVKAFGNDGAMYTEPAQRDENKTLTQARAASGGETGLEWAGSSFSDRSIRMAFIRKVYAILSVQLLVTVAFVAFFLLHEPTKNWIQHDGSWLYFVAYAVFLITYITLVCCASVRRKSPGNFICLTVFTLSFSYMTGMIASFHNVQAVLIAAGITALVCVSISVFACQTKFDFTMCSGLLFCFSMVLFFFGISVIITFSVWGYSYILQCVYGALAALLFSMFLAYDTQMLVGGRKHELSEEEHIFAALQLYLDVVYLFIIILSFFGGGKN